MRLPRVRKRRTKSVFLWRRMSIERKPQTLAKNDDAKTNRPQPLFFPSFLLPHTRFSSLSSPLRSFTPRFSSFASLPFASPPSLLLLPFLTFLPLFLFLLLPAATTESRNILVERWTQGTVVTKRTDARTHARTNERTEKQINGFSYIIIIVVSGRLRRCDWPCLFGGRLFQKRCYHSDKIIWLEVEASWNPPPRVKDMFRWVKQ